MTTHSTQEPAPTVATESIYAGPVKRFFIDILTRDIEIVAAILDLIDNSVDSAHALRVNKDLTGLNVTVTTSLDRFSIVDNCAGITLESAKEYVFRMGRPNEMTKSQPSSIGQFGVGMKRALFKLGDVFSVDSSTGDEHFRVDLDVAKWEKEPNNWNLDLKVLGTGPNGYPPNGTNIEVSELHDDVRDYFADYVRVNQLIEEVRSKHRIAIERGLAISINGSVLKQTPTALSADTNNPANLYPLIERFTLKDPEAGDVRVEIYAGIFGPTDAEEDAEPEDVVSGSAEAGWYIFGNDRLLLEADKTQLTGWGGTGNMPMFHNQYARFRGYVFMSATDSIALPWNTTKTGVESSDSIWIQVRGEMIKAGKQVIQVLNQLKLERRALRTDSSIKPNSDAVPITRVLTQASSLTATDLARAPAHSFTHVAPNPNLNPRADERRVSFTATMTEFDAAAEALGVSKPVDVGRGAFDYFLEQETDIH